MSHKYQAPKGVSEYFPPRSSLFEYAIEHLKRPALAAGYQLMELPVFEDTEVFSRGVGESTDVVTKEMYTFEDRGGRSLTLRPEGTAGVMRSVIEHGLDRGQLPQKFFIPAPFSARNAHKLVGTGNSSNLESKQSALTTLISMSK